MAKVFTLNEAQGLLPTLKGLLQSAMDVNRRAEELDGELRRILTRVLLLGGVQLDPARLAALKSERESALSRLKDTLAEIGAAGVQVKDLTSGLLDFPCLLEGRLVLLCWQYGEPSIQHWHGAEEGFAGRKKIDPSLFPSGPSRRLH